jgi:hypothetical protein
MIAPSPDALLEAYPVSLAINRVANDDARLIEPLTEAQAQAEAAVSTPPKPPPKVKKDDRQASLF